MHYIGTLGMIFPGKLSYSPGIVAGSSLIGVVGATVAYWILFRFLALYPEKVHPFINTSPCCLTMLLYHQHILIMPFLLLSFPLPLDHKGTVSYCMFGSDVSSDLWDAFYRFVT